MQVRTMNHERTSENKSNCWRVTLTIYKILSKDLLFYILILWHINHSRILSHYGTHFSRVFRIYNNSLVQSCSQFSLVTYTNEKLLTASSSAFAYRIRTRICVACARIHIRYFTVDVLVQTSTVTRGITNFMWKMNSRMYSKYMKRVYTHVHTTIRARIFLPSTVNNK